MSAVINSVYVKSLSYCYISKCSICLETYFVVALDCDQVHVYIVSILASCVSPVGKNYYNPAH